MLIRMCVYLIPNGMHCLLLHCSQFLFSKQLCAQPAQSTDTAHEWLRKLMLVDSDPQHTAHKNARFNLLVEADNVVFHASVADFPPNSGDGRVRSPRHKSSPVST